jgi:MarR family transcriptional regulator for hemolysin
MPNTDSRRALAHKMSLVSHAWRRLADRAVAEFGVSNSAAWCLIYVDRLGPHVRQTDLAEHLEITKPSLFRTVTQLETIGLIERQPNPLDARSACIVLTPAGQELVGRIEERLDALRSDLLVDIPEGAVDITLKLLDMLGRRIADRQGRP